MKNTPACINATAISKAKRVNRRIKEIIPHLLTFRDSQTTQEHRNISRCPAKRLAPNRNPRVIGWINRLIDSTKTMNGIKGAGVPLGTRWLSFLFHFIKNPSI
jgi:hypothetical protein